MNAGNQDLLIDDPSSFFGGLWIDSMLPSFGEHGTLKHYLVLYTPVSIRLSNILQSCLSLSTLIVLSTIFFTIVIDDTLNLGQTITCLENFIVPSGRSLVADVDTNDQCESNASFTPRYSLVTRITVSTISATTLSYIISCEGLMIFSMSIYIFVGTSWYRNSCTSKSHSKSTQSLTRQSLTRYYTNSSVLRQPYIFCSQSPFINFTL